MTAPGEHPFAVLGIAPTLDPGAVKRGYFTALQQSPPHADPAGFRRIREAYEKLSQLDQLFAAYMSSPPVIDVALTDLDANIGHEMSRLADAHAQRSSDAARGRSALDALSRLSLSDAQRMFGPQLSRVQLLANRSPTQLLESADVSLDAGDAGAGDAGND